MPMANERKPKAVRSTPKDNPSNVFLKVAQVKNFSYDKNIGLRKGVKSPKTS